MPSRSRSGTAEGRRNPKPMMNGMEKSDSVVIAVKSANKGTAVSAESMERRTEPEGNLGSQSTRRAQDRESVTQAADRIRRFVKREPRERLTTLLHHVTVDALRWSFYELKKDAAAGADGMTWRRYEEGLEGRLANLHDRVHSGAYRATPSRRVNIAKPGGGTRPLGVAALEDKIVQKAVTEMILTPIYEAEFLGFSYGFRPGRGAHDALDSLAVGIMQRKINWVVDCDIRAFFDTVSRDWMVRFLEQRIADKRVIRLIIKWLSAGVMEAGEWRDDLRGTPQGSVISPVLANVYLHYVLDLWFQKKWRKHEVTGDTIIVRYADDFVVGFQYRRDAERFLEAVKGRLGSFELEMHPEKSRLIEFGRYAREKPPEDRAGQTGDVRLPGLHALLCEDSEWALPAGAQPGFEANDAHPEANQGGSSQADASRCGGCGAMAREGGQRMAELLRRSEQHPIPAPLCPTPQADLAPHLAPQVAEGSLLMGPTLTTYQDVLAEAGNPTPVAGSTNRRPFHPREEPRALAGMRGSVRGVTHQWESLPRSS